jgi:hypothetical protein
MGDGGLDDDWCVADWGRDRSMSFRTKPEYLLEVPKQEVWETTLIFKRIYKIDYDIEIKHTQGYFLLDSLDRSIKPVIIITLYGAWENPNYRWFRPHIDAIIEEGNYKLLFDLFHQDVSRHI